jgi:hypothetical protein
MTYCIQGKKIEIIHTGSSMVEGKISRRPPGTGVEDCTCVPDLLPNDGHAQVEEDDAVASRAEHFHKVPDKWNMIIVLITS